MEIFHSIYAKFLFNSISIFFRFAVDLMIYHVRNVLRYCVVLRMVVEQ